MNNPARAKSLRRRCLRWAEHVLAVVGAVFLVYHAGFDLSRMVSPSMAPTLYGVHGGNDDWVLTEKISYLFRTPRRWEVVTFRDGAGQQVMKRVAGLPGEEIGIADGHVVVNGEPTDCPSVVDKIDYLGVGTLYRGCTASCGDGYFVLGDDTRDSQDSRYDGPIPEGSIAGRAWLRVWPPNRFGFVNP